MKEGIPVSYTLITGASSGIGRELAKCFAKDGHDLILVARRADALEQVKQELQAACNVDVVVMPEDLAQKDAAQRLYDKTVAAGYEVDHLVNNAGFGDCAPYLDSDWQRQYDMLELNVAAMMQATYLFGGAMRRRGFGRILNVSSVASFSGGPGMAIYYATKGFALFFSEALFEELRGTGVTVTALCPGPTRTAFEKEAKLDKARMFSVIPVADAEKVAQYAYRRMLQGKAYAYAGWPVKAMSFVSRLSPRCIARKFAAFVNGKK